MEGSAYVDTTFSNEQNYNNLFELAKDLMIILDRQGYTVTKPNESLASLWSSLHQPLQPSQYNAIPPGWSAATGTLLPCGTIVFALDMTPSFSFSQGHIVAHSPSNKVMSLIYSATASNSPSSCVGSISHHAGETLCSFLENWCADQFTFKIPNSLWWFPYLGEMFLSTDLPPTGAPYTQVTCLIPENVPAWGGWGSLADFTTTGPRQPELIGTQQALTQ